MEERNKLWRRKQQYRLLKSRIVKRADGFRGFMLDDGTYVQHPHWTQLIKSHWAQVYKTTPRLQARHQTNYRRIGNVKKAFW